MIKLALSILQHDAKSRTDTETGRFATSLQYSTVGILHTVQVMHVTMQSSRQLRKMLDY